jgi:CRP-like cAMP-binding protein
MIQTRSLLSFAERIPPGRNWILAALPEPDRGKVLQELAYVQAPLGTYLYKAGSPIGHVFFPVEGIVSMLYVTQEGKSGELALVGREGMIGLALFMGGETAPNMAVVQSACSAYRMPAASFKVFFSEGSALRLILLNYLQTVIAQISQTAVCNLHHNVEQQLCRWLLMSMDRIPGETLRMTQELIANMLGVRRQGVQEAAGRLEEKGLIRYHRGIVTILDRPGLEGRVCECYQALKQVPFARHRV